MSAKKKATRVSLPGKPEKSPAAPLASAASAPIQARPRNLFRDLIVVIGLVGIGAGALFFFLTRIHREPGAEPPPPAVAAAGLESPLKATSQPAVKNDAVADRPTTGQFPRNIANASRQALVIGNGHYKNLPQLDACAHDAQKMAEAFQKIGIRVQGGKPLIDLTVDQMDRALHDFAGTLSRGSEAFIYYSGHGAQIGGSNYLLPVSFNAEYESQARRQAISLDDILDLLEKTDSKLRVVILDACRDPGELLPGEPALKGLGQKKGMADQKVEAPETLVCFATKHGTAALAGENGSPYTDVLAEEIVKPGEIGAVMRTVARRVYETTRQRQLPFTYGSLLQDHFFVAPAETPRQQAVSAQAIPTPEPVPVTPVQMAKLTTPEPIVPRTTPSSVANGTRALQSATKEAPFVNSLGMKFVPVPGTKVLFSIWDTRVQDYAPFATFFRLVPDFEQGPTHPVVKVTWRDAQAFCQWLSQKEGRTYRLPTDEEWSIAVGLGVESGATPEEKQRNSPGAVYPWGKQFPPPKKAGNYAAALKVDLYEYTSPVGSFASNRYGLYDMGGNVWQWCEDWYNAEHEERVARGGSWLDGGEAILRSSYRNDVYPASNDDNRGFRCVLVIPGG